MDDESCEEDIVVYNKHDDESKKVDCIMLATMSPDHQKSFDGLGAYEINDHLKEMFQEKTRQESLYTIISLTACKHQYENFICVHQKMKSKIDRLLNFGATLLLLSLSLTRC